MKWLGSVVNGPDAPIPRRGERLGAVAALALLAAAHFGAAKLGLALEHIRRRVSLVWWPRRPKPAGPELSAAAATP